MRSEQVFRAREQVTNPYLLCRLTARTTRCLHFASSNTRDAIEDAFVRLGRQDGTCHAPSPQAIPSALHVPSRAA